MEVSFEPVSLANARPLWDMEDKGERYATRVELLKQHDGDDPASYLKLQCQGRGVFAVDRNSIRVDWHEGGTGPAHYFQTLGLALWLELKQVLCIHANALAYKDKAIALVAPSRMGKTTLTAALSRAGFALMTDDMLALHQEGEDYVVYPSWPVARMWPDTLDSFIGNTGQQLSRVHESFDKRIVQIADVAGGNEKGGKQRNATGGFDFCAEPKALSTIYLLNRVPGSDKQGNVAAPDKDCEIVPVTASRAAMTLIQNSMLGSCYAALGLEKQRVKVIAELLKKVKIKQINYSSGIEKVDKVCSALSGDLNG